MNVLYVEDNAVDADLARRHLAEHAPHIQLTVVGSAAEALAGLAERGKPGEEPPPDVMLLAVRSGDVGAVDLLGTVHDEKGIDLPVVLLSGPDDGEWAVQTFRLGASQFIMKQPGYLMALPALIESAHDRAQLARGRNIFLAGQKMEMLGTMTGSVAHNFNNTLAGIKSCNELNREDLPEDSPVQENLNLIDQAIEHGAELCRQILAYTGRVSIQVERFDLNQLLQGNSRLIDISRGHGIKISLELAEDLPAVNGDVEQLSQVLLSLLLNAVETIGGDAGTIAVSTGVMAVGDDDIVHAKPIGDIQAGLYTYLEVSDSGPGMPEEAMDTIFDPFHSAQISGRSPRLAAVPGLVRSHGGALLVTSEVDHGSTFRVLIPVADAED
jgi:signal transduction histidine kinase